MSGVGSDPSCASAQQARQRAIWATLALVIVAQVCVHAAMSGTRLAAPLALLQAGYSQALVGMLLSLFAAGPIALSLHAGRWADQWGYHRPVYFAIGATVLGTFLAFASLSVWAWCLSALLTGTATSFALVSAQRQAGRLARDATELKRIFSWLAIGPAVSNFLGPFVTGLLIDHAGFRVAAGFMMLLPFLAWFAARRVPAEPVSQSRAEETGLSDRAMGLVRDGAFRRLLVINWCLSVAWDVHTFVVPVLGHERGLSASVIGAILGGFALAAAAVRVVIPMVAERLEESQVLKGAMAVTAVIYAVYPFMPGAWTMGLASALLGLALGMVQPMVMAALHQLIAPRLHGSAIGLRMMVLNVSSTVMPMLFGVGGAVVGAAHLFWLIAFITGSGSLLVKRLSSDLRRAEHNPPD